MRLRDDPRRLDPEAYPHSIDIRAAFADMDVFRHLNNVAIVRYFEEARATTNMTVFGQDAVVRPGAVQLLFASLVIDYVSQGRYPGLLQACVGVTHIGRSSYVQACALFQDGGCVALSDATTVYAVDGRGQEIPVGHRQALQALTFRS